MNTDQFLCFRNIKLCVVCHFEDVAGQSAVAEWDVNLHARFNFFFHSLRNPILKCLIQFIQRNIYNYIRVHAFTIPS